MAQNEIKQTISQIKQQNNMIKTKIGNELKHPSRVGAVALYTVLWTVVAKYRKWRFSAPHRTKTH
jgi:predicted phage-related endonuclease